MYLLHLFINFLATIEIYFFFGCNLYNVSSTVSFAFCRNDKFIIEKVLYMLRELSSYMLLHSGQHLNFIL